VRRILEIKHAFPKVWKYAINLKIPTRLRGISERREDEKERERERERRGVSVSLFIRHRHFRLTLPSPGS